MDISALLRSMAFGVAVTASGSVLCGPNGLTEARTRELVRLVRQDCGSCHGLSLKGGLGPALLPAALQDKPEESLKATILMGRPGTAMPPWGRFLTEVEVDWILARLRAGFPEEERR